MVDTTAPGATWFVPGFAVQAAIASTAVGHVVAAEVGGGTAVVVVTGGAVVVTGGGVVVVVGAEVETEVEVRRPVNEMGQPWKPPDASRLSWPVPVISLPPLPSVIVMSSMISFAGSTRTT